MAFKSRLKCLFLKPIFCILFATFLHFARNTTRVKEDANLQNYVNTYYRNRLKLAITREQVMIMNSKAGAVCSWLYRLASLFGIQTQKAIFIDLQVTNEDIANFCGITTRNSVNRVIRGLKEKHVIQVKNNRIIVLDMDYLKQFTK